MITVKDINSLRLFKFERILNDGTFFSGVAQQLA